MEIDELQIRWEELSVEIKNQKKISDALIIKMTDSNYRNKINRIIIPETMGAFFCLISVLFILINFQKLETWYLLTSGVLSILILLLLPLLSFKAIRSLRSLNISGNNYKQSLLEYSKGKIQFIRVQKASFYLGALLILVILPVMGKLIGGKDLFMNSWLWMSYVIGYPFFYAFSKWVFKNYTKTVGDAENILNELDN